MEEFPHGILAAWSFPVWPAIGLAITGMLYLRGWRALQRTRAWEMPVWRAQCFFGGLLAQSLFDGPECPGHVEQLAHFRFADMKCHCALLHPSAALPQ